MRKLLLLIVGSLIGLHSYAALEITNVSSSATDTSATFIVKVVSTNAQNPDVILYFGVANGGEVAGRWGASIDLGTNAPDAVITNTIYRLRPQQDYYWHSAAHAETNVWAKGGVQTVRTILAAPPASTVLQESFYGAAPTSQPRISNLAAWATLTNLATGTPNDTNLVTQVNAISNAINKVNELLQALKNQGLIR